MGSMSELMDRARHRISVGDYHKMADAGVLGTLGQPAYNCGGVFLLAAVRCRVTGYGETLPF
jgi:hypothetical protein